MNYLQNYSSAELIAAMLKYVSNQKLVNKFGIAYKIGMIDSSSLCLLYSDHYTRKELLEVFTSILNEDTINKVIKSEYTAKQLQKFL
jgi:hypothetical protein